MQLLTGWWTILTENYHSMYLVMIIDIMMKILMPTFSTIVTFLRWTLWSTKELQAHFSLRDVKSNNYIETEFNMEAKMQHSSWISEFDISTAIDKNRWMGPMLSTISGPDTFRPLCIELRQAKCSCQRQWKIEKKKQFVKPDVLSHVD